MRAYISQTPNEKSIRVYDGDTGGPVVELYGGCRAAKASILSAVGEVWLYGSELWVKGRSGPIALPARGKK
jgi:hypothetical protein